MSRLYMQDEIQRLISWSQISYWSLIFASNYFMKNVVLNWQWTKYKIPCKAMRDEKKVDLIVDVKKMTQTNKWDKCNVSRSMWQMQCDVCNVINTMWKYNVKMQCENAMWKWNVTNMIWLIKCENEVNQIWYGLV